MPYRPICNLHGVSEDHALRFHGVIIFKRIEKLKLKIIIVFNKRG